MTSRTPEPRYSWLDGEVSRGATIVTASRRLARDLFAVYGDRRIADGLKAWPTPPVHFWTDWLTRISSAAADPAQVPRRLDAASVTVLWERCLGRRVAENVLSPRGVIREAQRAWQRLAEWGVPVSALLASAATEDERLFARSAADYSDLLRSNHWTDEAGLPASVSSLIAGKSAPVPARVVFAGFDRITPSLQAVCTALESVACEIDIRPQAARSKDVEIVAFADESAELRAAGAWARRQLEQDPAAKIAIVSPMPETGAAEVARLVREGLVPGWQYGGDVHRAAANVSFGRRLADYPAISVALSLLRWSCQDLPGQDISLLLRSNCLGLAERGGRCRLEQALRTLPDREWSPASLRMALSGIDDAADALAFLATADAASALRAGDSEGERMPSEWVQTVDELLATAGWPGPAALDSAGYQLVDRWRELMNEFARVGTVLSTVSWGDAVTRISALALDTLWQPEMGPGAVTVLGALETFGMEFDAVRVCGMDASRWPPASRPLSLVARRLQRERGMPDATPADTLSFARRLMGRLAGSAPNCVFSWPRIRQDATLTRSTLLDAVTVTRESESRDPGWSARRLVGTAELEVVGDDAVPAVSLGERIAGGSYTLQRQFTNPFSAFVHGRLGVRPLEPFRRGLSPGVRGNVIHNALHNLLADLPAQADIAGWPDREQRIGSAVDSALQQPGRYADPVLQRLIGLESSRLRQLLGEFVEAELGRPAFAVHAVEKDLDYRRGNVALGFRIDRVDRLPNGRLLVIDYKTGMLRTFQSRAGELQDLQLVAYADALDEPVGGLLFINIDTRTVAYRAAGDGLQESPDEDWDTTLQDWLSRLHEVVAALAAGDARVALRQTTADARPLAILSRFEELKRDA